MKTLLTVSHLSISIDDKQIVRDLSLSIRPGELHVLMGPNGSGKSTIAYALMGHPQYRVRAQTLTFAGVDVKKKRPDQRAKLGMFLAFQYPLAISGLSLGHLTQSALAAHTKEKSASDDIHLTLASKLASEQRAAREDFEKRSAQLRTELKLADDMLYRSLNEGFSGGEKKKAELFQMLMLRPKLAILDEPDSGLDVDALKILARSIDRAHKQGMAIILITHYQRILKYLHPDTVHVLVNGRVVAKGTQQLAQRIEKNGYESLASARRT